MNVEQKQLKKMQRLLFKLGLFKIPIIGFVKPKLLKLTSKEIEIRIRLRRRTKNHLDSMYFGALAVGADLAAGIHAFYFADVVNCKLSFSFKAFSANFIKRAESDVLFKINQGDLIELAINKSLKNKERVNQEVLVVATDIDNQIVAEFKMLVSVKAMAY